MLALAIRPRRSRWYWGVIAALHTIGLLVVVNWLHGALLVGVLVAMVISWAYAQYRWHHSAAYFLSVTPDGKASLQWRDQNPIWVQVVAVPLHSVWVTMVVWEDAHQQRYRTLLWQDSVDKAQYKLWYVWLRWQPRQ